MIKMKKRAFVLTLVSVVLAAALATCGVLYFCSDAVGLKLVESDNYEKMEDISEKYNKLYNLQNIINENFLWETDEKAQFDAMYKALVDSLGDEYSVYMNEKETKAWNSYVTGVFTGVGITISQNKKGDIVVRSVMEGGPADVSGMKEKDIILKVDGKKYKNIDEAAAALRGKEGSQVKVTIARGDKTETISVVRGQVEEQSVFSKVIDGKYGYIRIASFEKSTAKQFATEVAGFEKKGLSGMIIDLRMNTGGLMDQSIEIADMLLPECTIIHTEDGKGEKEYYNSDGKCTKLNYVLLVNEYSASASEILAAAVKDNKGGKIVGVKTYGKGIIQSSQVFEDHTGLRLTTMQYLSPKNHKIHGVGIAPDYEVKLPAKSKTDKQLEKAIELLK